MVSGTTTGTSPAQPNLGGNAMLKAMGPHTTGRSIVTFKRDVPKAARDNVIDQMGRTLAGQNHEFMTMAAGARAAPKQPSALRILTLDRFGIAVIEAPSGTSAMAMAQSFEAMAEVETSRPEYYLYATEEFGDDEDATWGLRATRAIDSVFTGKGIKVAVLDTGLALNHPDFIGRDIVSESFVPFEGVDDQQGHGTHCAGVIVGPRVRTQTSPAYGIAPDATLYVGKVLNNAGSGREMDIARGIDWALDQGCDIISMSLGRSVTAGVGPDANYERLGAEALEAGSLIVAAAGNDSHRTTGFVAPVSIPANSPSIVAVAAIDSDLAVANFSNGSTNRAAAGIDIAAPGVGVFSSFLVERPYRILQGTSMACPHVAGIAALYAESDPSLRGRALWKALTGDALALPLEPGDVGAGLVQAPKKPPATS